MKFPVDITHELRAARRHYTYKRRLALCGVCCALTMAAIAFGVLLASVSAPKGVVALAILLWGAWGVRLVTRK